MANIKFSAFTQKVAQADVDFLVGYTGADNVRIAPSTLGDGIYLPLAGGTMTGDLIVADNVKIEVGNATGGDLQIYHDTTDSFVSDQGTGKLKVLSNDFELRNAANTEDMINAHENGNVVLFFDNDAKFATQSGGTETTGTHTATTFSGSGASLTNLPAANVAGQLPTGSTLTLDYDSLPTSDPGVKGRLWRSGATALQVSAG